MTWIYPENNDPIGVGEGLVPEVSKFLKDLGVTTEDLMTHANGTLKIGGKFEEFSQGESFVFPFGIGNGATGRIMDLNKIPNNMLDYEDISVHFRATELLKYLDTIYPQFENLKIIRDTVNLEDLDGSFDLIIDSTGFGRHLLGNDEGFVSLNDRIPNDTAYVYRQEYTDKDAQFLPYTLFVGMDYGWIWNIPLGEEIAFGYVHDGEYDVMDSFIEYLNEKLGVKVDQEKISKVRMQTGRNTTHLKGNKLYIGLASSFIEPIESTGLYLVVNSLNNLQRYIDGEIEESQYNENINNDFDSIVDFVLAHYKFSNRENDYWKSYKSVDIDLYSRNEIFPPEAWDHILSGFGEAKTPEYKLDPMLYMKIIKGEKYKDWYEKNFK